MDGEKNERSESLFYISFIYIFFIYLLRTSAKNNETLTLPRGFAFLKGLFQCTKWGVYDVQNGEKIEFMMYKMGNL